MEGAVRRCLAPVTILNFDEVNILAGDYYRVTISSQHQYNLSLTIDAEMWREGRAVCSFRCGCSCCTASASHGRGLRSASLAARVLRPELLSTDRVVLSGSAVVRRRGRALGRPGGSGSPGRHDRSSVGPAVRHTDSALAVQPVAALSPSLLVPGAADPSVASPAGQSAGMDDGHAILSLSPEQVAWRRQISFCKRPADDAKGHAGLVPSVDCSGTASSAGFASMLSTGAGPSTYDGWHSCCSSAWLPW